jgi:hypothetical protein
MSFESTGKVVGVDHPVTPDGRYFVVKGRLWRCSNPSLRSEERQQLVNQLMSARRAKKSALAADDASGIASAKKQVNDAKVALGEREPVWWDDDQPDLTRTMVENSPYSDWWADIRGAK